VEARPHQERLFSYGDPVGSVDSKDADFVPREPGAAAVQKQVQAERGANSGFVAVQRLRASGPVPAGAEKLHEKSEGTVSNLAAMPTITAMPLSNAGTAASAVCKAWQASPALLDSPAALLSSPLALAALQVLGMEAGGPPPRGALLQSSAAVELTGTAMTVAEGSVWLQ
jgi:hypothetical protein